MTKGHPDAGDGHADEFGELWLDELCARRCSASAVDRARLASASAGWLLPGLGTRACAWGLCPRLGPRL